MKKIIILALITGIGAFSCNQIASEAKAEIAVPTIQCGMCVDKIEGALTKVEGVKSAKVDLEKKMTLVVYNDKTTNLQSLEKTITDAGYNANDKTRNPEAYASLSMCCKESTDR